jgi:ubiquinone/menaquinone biosynthesis C-methylase UbiE
MKMEKSKINEHYNSEVKIYSDSPKCTMPDLFIRKLEVLKIEDTIKKIVAQDDVSSILEIGCGNGYTISQLRNSINSRFVGVDSNKNMIKLALKRRLRNIEFKVDDILKTKIKDESFDIIFTERCLINIMNWNLQLKSLEQIRRILRKGGYFIMLEAFDDGLNILNATRRSLGLEKIDQAWHNYYFKKKRFEAYAKGKFYDWKNSPKHKITYDNFLSSYYFGSRVLYPSLISGKKEIQYNNKFVEYFSLVPSVGNFSPIQLCVLQKI